jgi:ribosomal protein L37E
VRHIETHRCGKTSGEQMQRVTSNCPLHSSVKLRGTKDQLRVLARTVLCVFGTVKKPLSLMAIRSSNQLVEPLGGMRLIICGS